MTVSIRIATLIALVSWPAFADNAVEIYQPAPSRPAWLGLTPLYNPEEHPTTQDEQVKHAEQVMAIGRQGFWYGLAGLVVASVSDRMQLYRARTFGYSVMGLGWLTWLGSYGRATSLLSNTNSQPESRPSVPAFARASTQGEIGEASNMFLIPNGAYVHPIYNDVNGGTDKLLTGSAKLGVTHGGEKFGWETVGYWRLLTPSFRREFGQPNDSTPVGRYADWQELKTSFSGLSDISGWTIRHQASVGYNDVGPKGGKQFHQKIHKITRNTLDHLEYTNQPEGQFWSFSGEVGTVSHICMELIPCFDQALSIEGTQGKFMREAGIRYNIVQVQLSRWWENGLEFRLIRQLKSDVYAGIRPWRYEAAIGARLLKVITPTVKFISPYLTGDGIGQTYFDFLHYNFEF